MIEFARKALELLQAKWKLDLLCLMAGGILRYARLFDNLPGISNAIGVNSTLLSYEARRRLIPSPKPVSSTNGSPAFITDPLEQGV
jgi:hypothetical protein